MLIVNKLFPFNKYSLSGSIGRFGFVKSVAQLFFTTFVAVLLPVLLNGVIGLIVNGGIDDFGSGVFGGSLLGIILVIPVMISWFISVILILYGLVCVSVQRLRSTNLSPKLLWLNSLPLVFLLIFDNFSFSIYYLSVPVCFLVILIAIPTKKNVI